MAKKQKKKSNPVDILANADAEHAKKVELYTKMVSELYKAAVDDLTKLAFKINFVSAGEDEPFSFDANPKIAENAAEVIQKLCGRIQAVVEKGNRSEWIGACEKSAKFIESIINTTKLTKHTLERYQDRNIEALSQFQQRKVNGLDLSERIWKYVEPLKDEVEVAVDVTKYYKHGINSSKSMTKMDRAIGEGMSAAELSREVRSCLKEPNKLFRRVRDKYGNLHLSKAAKLYHPGQGVYRSSYKNAMRMTRTEINMAYRQSDYMRWQQLDFVVGMEVNLSNNHTIEDPKTGQRVPFHDMCDNLAGKYPKDFKFVGWHPQCKCFVTPILKSLDEVDKDVDANGEYHNLPSASAVNDVPQGFKDYIVANEERMNGWKSQPYYLKDNPQFVDKALHPDKYVKQPLVLDADTQKRLSELTMYGFNHSGSKLFNAALEAAKKAQLDGDLAEFQKQMAEMERIIKKNEGSTISKAKNKNKKSEEFIIPEMDQKLAIITREKIIRNAKKRHEARSKDEIDNIQVAWNKRKLKNESLYSDLKNTEDYIVKAGLNREDLDIMLTSRMNGTDEAKKLFKKYEAEFEKAKDKAYKKYDKLSEIGLEFEKIGTDDAKKLFDEIAKFSSDVYNRPDEIAYINGKEFDKFFKDMNKQLVKMKSNTSKFVDTFDRLSKRKIVYNEPSVMNKKQTDDEIIAKIGGGDRTSGSCSSCALAFAGNKGGFDVRDFRGGDSMDYFSSRDSIKRFVTEAGGTVVTGYNDFTSAHKLMGMMSDGKYYYFACGGHAAIIRKNGAVYEFLELQSPVQNGFKSLNDYVLKTRFGAKQSRSSYGFKFEIDSFLVDIDKLNADSGFKKMLGYINTAEADQKKGTCGSIK